MAMTKDKESLGDLLSTAKYSIDACVVVGGTLLVDCYNQLKACGARGINIRFLYPDPHSSWLIPIVSSVGISIEAYQKRITNSAQRAQQISSNVEVRWHGNPVLKWFVIIDQNIVASKHINMLTKTYPEIEYSPDVAQFYKQLYESIWISGSNDRTGLSVRAETRNNRFKDLRVFLCHSSEDKPAVRDLYDRLTKLGIDSWLDERKILPGQDWDHEITRALKEAHLIIICLSKKSGVKRGYIQKELRNAIAISQEYPEGTIFLIPARLEDCAIPKPLQHLQWVNICERDGYDRLLESLLLRAGEIAQLPK